MKKSVIVLLLLVGSVFFPFSSIAKSLSTANVIMRDPVYRDLDKLISYGLIERFIKGQRPYSRQQIALMVLEAKENFSQSQFDSDDRVIKILNRLEKRFAEEMSHEEGQPGFATWRFHPLDAVSAEAAAAKSTPRFAPNQGQGQTAGVIDPLKDFRNGRHFAPDGVTLAVQSEHFVGLTDYFSLHAVPLFEMETDRNYFHARIAPQVLNFKTVFRNIALEIGRDQVVRGFGEYGGLLHSNNARGFDRISLSNEIPVVLPWIFKYAGPVQLDFYATHLGPESFFNDTWMTGWALNFSPLSFLEFGLLHGVILGGAGAPPVSPGTAVKEFFGFIPSDASTPGDALVEASFRAALPPLRHAEFYFHFAFDDQNFEPDVFFLHDSGYYAGIFLPRVDAQGLFDLRLEYRHTPSRLYTHGIFLSGKSLNGRSFGDPIGPDADSLSLRATYDVNDALLLGFNSAVSFYDSNVYATVGTGTDVTGIRTVTDGPLESRVLVGFDGLYRWNRFEFGAEIAGEYVSAFNFVPSDNRVHFFSTVNMTYR